MARGKGGLGRGLDSLFEDAAPVFESEHAAVETLPLREIEPDPDQPRKTFEQETLSELAASIAEHGLLQPIAVRPRPMGGYSIVAGERRWRASRMAGLTEVPVVIKDVSDEQAMELALVENLQREDLDPVEEAAGIRELMTRCDLTQEQAARKLGKSRSALANSLRLLNLPETVLELLKSGFINTGHAKVVLVAHAGTAGRSRADHRGQPAERPSGRGALQKDGKARQGAPRTRTPRHFAGGGGREPETGAGQRGERGLPRRQGQADGAFLLRRAAARLCKPAGTVPDGNRIIMRSKAGTAAFERQRKAPDAPLQAQ